MNRQSAHAATMNHLVRLATVSLCSLLLAVPAGAADIIMSDTQIRAMAIETAQPQPADRAPGAIYPAQVRVPPANETVLAAPVDGLIEQVFVAEGESVEAGDPIVRLRSSGLVELQRGFLQARTARHTAEQALQRDRSLAAEGIIAERRLEETRSRFIQAVAEFDSLRQSLILAGVADEAISRLAAGGPINPALELVAPQGGTVLDLMVAAGERVQASTGLARISRLDALWLEVRLPVEQLGQVSLDSRVTIVGSDLVGKVILIGSRVTMSDQTVMVRAAFNDVAGRLRPGQYVRARLQDAASGEMGDGVGLFRVPASAVVREGDDFYVFVVVDGGFDARPVERLGPLGDSLIIRADLSRSEAVAVVGVANVKGAWQGVGDDE